jgi:hypothetical protein
LQWADLPCESPAGPGQTKRQKGAVPAHTEPSPPNAVLCERLGGQKEFQLYVSDARRLVRELPALRDNVAAWRVRQGLLLLRPDRADGTRDANDYADALAQREPALLRQMLPSDTQLVRLSLSSGSKETPAEERWFMRLSGQCVGFSKPEQNGVVACGKGSCAAPKVEYPPTLTNEAERKLDVQLADMCVLAELPAGPVVAEGKPRGDALTQGLLASGLTFLQQTAYYRRLALQNNIVGALEMATYARPPSVQSWYRVTQPPEGNAPAPGLAASGAAR